MLARAFFPLIGYVLFIANKGYRSQEFYKAKSWLLNKLGEFTQIDYQFFEGKTCWTCDGTGEVYRHSNFSGREENQSCRDCLKGWYHPAKWVTLYKFSLGGYSFHIPGDVSYSPPAGNPVIIHGFITKERHRLTGIAQTIILISCGQGAVKRYFRNLGVYYVDGSFFNNLVHLVRNPLSATQYRIITERAKGLFRGRDISTDDLPF